MPLVIVLVAVAIALWGNRQAPPPNTQEVKQHVLNLCRVVGEGGDLRGRLNPDDPFTEQRTIEQLRNIIPARDHLPQVSVETVAAQSLPAGAIPQRANHHMMLTVRGLPELGLHIEHPGAGRPIHVLGYWRPNAAITP